MYHNNAEMHWTKDICD